jgi:excinuclease ABC subunit C
VGDKRKGRLLRHFGSIQRIARAGVSELTPFVGRKTAEEIAEHFERQRLLAAKPSTDYTDQPEAPSPRTPLNS